MFVVAKKLLALKHPHDIVPQIRLFALNVLLQIPQCLKDNRGNAHLAETPEQHAEMTAREGFSSQTSMVRCSHIYSLKLSCCDGLFSLSNF